jgi:hypothetical protein
MNWKRVANSGLERATSHLLVRADGLDDLKAALRSEQHRAESAERSLAARRGDLRALQAELNTSSERVERLEAQIAKLESRLKPRAKPKLPSDYAPATQAIWERVQDRTMTGHAKINAMVEAMFYVEANHIPGAVVECGVWRGGSMMAGVLAMLELQATQRDFYMFDTYEGMTAPTERDVHISIGRTAEEMLDGTHGGAPLWVPASVEDVRAGFEPLGYPEDKLHFVVGKVEDTIPSAAPDTIAVLRLDTDWYESTKHELAHLFDRLQPGGVLIIDDYGSWQGSKDAVDEFIAATGEPLLMTKVGRGRIAVKQGLRAPVRS